MITEILIALPIIAAVLVAFLKGNTARTVALVASLAELGIAIVALTMFNHTVGTQFFVNRPWIPSFGIIFKAGMDGISLLLVVLTAVLTPLIILSTLKREFKNAGLFFGNCHTCAAVFIVGGDLYFVRIERHLLFCEAGQKWLDFVQIAIVSIS